jgi:hypothetical protein
MDTSLSTIARDILVLARYSDYLDEPDDIEPLMQSIIRDINKLKSQVLMDPPKKAHPPSSDLNGTKNNFTTTVEKLTSLDKMPLPNWTSDPSAINENFAGVANILDKLNLASILLDNFKSFISETIAWVQYASNNNSLTTDNCPHIQQLSIHDSVSSSEDEETTIPGDKINSCTSPDATQQEHTSTVSST